MTKRHSSSKPATTSVASVIDEIRGGRSPSSVDLLQGITKLHDRIVKDLEPRDLIFFLDFNLAVTKITEATEPILVSPVAGHNSNSVAYIEH